jgi:hypothetical protein
MKQENLSKISVEKCGRGSKPETGIKDMLDIAILSKESFTVRIAGSLFMANNNG